VNDVQITISDQWTIEDAALRMGRRRMTSVPGGCQFRDRERGVIVLVGETRSEDRQDRVAHEVRRSCARMMKLRAESMICIHDQAHTFAREPAAARLEFACF
jgi:hypothetical protein